MYIISFGRYQPGPTGYAQSIVRYGHHVAWCHPVRSLENISTKEMLDSQAPIINSYHTKGKKTLYDVIGASPLDTMEDIRNSASIVSHAVDPARTGGANCILSEKGSACL